MKKQPSENALRDYYTKMTLMSLFVHAQIASNEGFDGVQELIDNAEEMTEALLKKLGPPPV